MRLSLLFLASSALVSVVAFAAKPAGLPDHSTGKTLAECFQAAVGRSEIIASNTELIRQAEDVYNQAIGSVLPNVSGIGTYQWQQDTASGIGATINPNPSHSARLTATQPLFQGFKEYAGLSLAKAGVRASENDKKQALTQLYSDTATAFFTVVTLERDIDNLNDEMALYEKRIGDLRQFQQIGRSRTSEVLTAQSQEALLNGQLQQVKGQLRAEREVLAFVTGFDAATPLAHPPDGAVGAKTIDEYLSRLEARPDVQGDMARLKEAEEGVPVARSGHFPTLGVQGDYYLDRTGTLSNVNWDVLFTLTVPIFSGGLVSAQVDQAQSKRDQADYVLTRTKRAATQQIRSYYANFLSDKSQFDAFSQASDLAERNYKEETHDYRRGLVTNLDVLTALTSYKESQRSQDRSQYAMMLDVENLEAAAAYRGADAKTLPANTPPKNPGQR